MIDWKEPMIQTFEYFIVDPNTWADMTPVTTVTSSTFNRDETNETLGSAQIDTTEEFEECYIRGYLVATQDEKTERVALGTVLVQTPSVKFDGKISTMSLDAYTPLIELKNVNPPIGYTMLKNEKIVERACDLVEENTRVPIVTSEGNGTKLFSNYTANTDDTWLSYLTNALANDKSKFGLDEMGRITIEPIQETAALRPVWTYSDDNSSILYPDTTKERDLYNVPNVVEVIYSSATGYYRAVVENKDPNSPVSIQNRGRRVEYRETNPTFYGEPNQAMINEYAKTLLKNLSCLEYKITYTHGYCPVRVGDAVILKYESAGLVNVKAKVISQSINCVTGCSVEETAVYTEQLWG